MSQNLHDYSDFYIQLYFILDIFFPVVAAAIISLGPWALALLSFLSPPPPPPAFTLNQFVRCLKQMTTRTMAEICLDFGANQLTELPNYNNKQ